MLKRLGQLLLDPIALRNLVLRTIQRFEIGSYEYRIKIGAVLRARYAYCMYHAAELARWLGYSRMSVIEFGVAGGNGLMVLEAHAREISKLFEVEIEIYGFDTGTGLPEPLDYRDLPYMWQKGFFKMDLPALQARLSMAKVVLGDINDTSHDFFEKYNPAPIGAIMYDLDYYSSTAVALKMLEAGDQYYLPRVFCYFDDIIGSEIELYNDYTGQRLAIHEFNRDHQDIKLSMLHYLLASPIVSDWHRQLRICHFLKHVRYNDFIGRQDQQLRCRL